MRRQAEAGQQLAEHSLGIGGVSANEGAHANAVATLAGEGPAKTVAHQAKFKAGRARVAHLAIHLHRHCFGVAGLAWTKAMASRQQGAGAIGDDHGPGL